MINRFPIKDIQDIFREFDILAQHGRKYLIELCTHVPDENDLYSTTSFLRRVTTGHSFIRITTNERGTSISRAFGFYPRSTPSPWSLFSPLPSVIREDGSKEVSAFLEMDTGYEQYLLLRSMALDLTQRPYLLLTNNCTDFAVNVFCSIFPFPIDLEPHTIYWPKKAVAMMTRVAVHPIIINRTPQGLFEVIRKLKENKESAACRGTAFENSACSQ